MVRMLSSSSVMPPAPGLLVLRVRGSSRDGQIVRLQSSKCTIGSGYNCTLRIQADNIGPVHCLILRGPNRTVVRRWSPDTRLNGRNFTESELQAGDYQSIGAIDLEVEETEQPSLPSEKLRDQQRTIDQQLAQIEVRLRSLDEQQAEMNELRAQWECRHAEIDRQWDTREVEFEAQKAELQARQAQWETIRCEQVADLEARRTMFTEETTAWEAIRSKQAAELDAVRTLLKEEHAAGKLRFAEQAADLEAARTSLDEQHVAWETRHSEHVADLEAARASLNEERTGWEATRSAQAADEASLSARQVEFDNRVNALEELQAEWESAKRESQANLDARAAELDALRAELDSVRAQLADESRQWERGQAEMSTSHSATAEQLAAQQAGLEVQRRALEEQSEEGASLEDASSDSGAVENSPIDASASLPYRQKPVDAAEVEELSIDEYVSRLLARLRGNSVQSIDRTARAVQARAAAPSAPVPASTSPPAAPGPRCEPPKPGEPVEMAPRAVAPEKHADMNVMRQLANLSATNALEKHESKRLSGPTRSKLLVAAVSAVAGVSLLVVHQLPGAPPVTIYGALASFAVAGLWGVKYLSLSSRIADAQRANVSRQPKAGEDTAEEVEQENLQ